jgi:hypothetical protein
MSAEAMVHELALELPPPFPPAGIYVNAVRTGSLLALGGHVPIGADQQIVLGKLGEDLDVDAGDATRASPRSARWRPSARRWVRWIGCDRSCRCVAW